VGVWGAPVERDAARGRRSWAWYGRARSWRNAGGRSGHGNATAGSGKNRRGAPDSRPVGKGGHGRGVAPVSQKTWRTGVRGSPRRRRRPDHPQNRPRPGPYRAPFGQLQPSDPRRSILPRGDAGWAERGDQEGKALGYLACRAGPNTASVSLRLTAPGAHPEPSPLVVPASLITVSA